MRKHLFVFASLVLFFGALMLPTAAHADTLTVADSNIVSGEDAYTFVHFPTFATTTQMVYPSWMLTALNGNTITALTLYVNTPFSASLGGITVKLSEIADTAVGSAIFDHSAADNVYTGAVSAPSGEIVFTFDNPYQYNGGNLLLTVTSDGTATENVYSEFLGISRTAGSIAAVSFMGMDLAASEDFLAKATFTYSQSSGSDCGRPGPITVSGLTADSATFSWGPSDNGSTYIVSLDGVAMEPTYDTFVVLDGLAAHTTYAVSVVTDCGDTTSLPRATTFTTLCTSVDLPWSYDFDNDVQGSMPACWEFPLVYSYSYFGISFTFPMIEEDVDDNHLLYFGYEDTSVTMAASPMINHDANGLEVSFSAKLYYNSSLQAGVMTDRSDTVTFIPLLTIENNSSDTTTPMTEYTFYTENIAAEGNVCIAFKVVNTADVDNVMVSEALDCHRPEGPAVYGVTFDSAYLSWSGDEDGTFIVELVNERTGDTAVFDNLTDTVLVLEGLSSATTYNARVATLCGSDTTTWALFPPFTTLISCYTVVDATIDSLDSTSVSLSWQYSELGLLHQGAEIILTDLTDPDAEPIVEFVAGTSVTFTGLATFHLYSAALRTVCDEQDTSTDIVLAFAPTGLPCAQIKDTVGLTTTYYPIDCYYKYSYSQTVYPASEVGDMDTIYGIALRYHGNYNGDAQSVTQRTIDVYMADTSVASLSGNMTADQMTKVLDNGTVNVGGNPGWINIIFDTPYPYGGENLVVAIDDNTGSYSVSYYWGTHQATEGNCVYSYSDNTNFDPANTMNLSSTSTVPDIRIFGNCESPITPDTIPDTPEPGPGPLPGPDTVWRTLTVGTNATGAAEPYGSGTYADSSTVEIGFLLADTAAQGGHWEFLGWSDGATDNPRSVVLVSDSTITALFQWETDTTDTTDTTGIVAAYSFDFDMYPNPATSTITVKTQTGAMVSIVDMNGREVYRSSDNATYRHIDISTFCKGAFFVRVATAKGIAVKKLIVR